MAFLVDVTQFQAEGALLNWSAVARRLGLFNSVFAAGPAFPNVLQLRWYLADKLGFPSEPFTVWRRIKKLREPRPIAAEIDNFGMFLSQLVDLKDSYSMVRLTASGAGGAVYGFVGSPWMNNIVALSAIPAGNNVVVELTAPSIEGLIVSNSVAINSLAGVRSDNLSAAAGWERYERVGLPVKRTAWAGIGKHGEDQGMFGAFVDAETAARQRLDRGSPPFGWAPLLEPGLPAPSWSAPQFGPLLADLNHGVLDDLRTVVGLAPAAHAAQKVTKTVPRPQNSLGQKMSGSDSAADVAPLAMTYMAAGTDCFNALGLGFGTAYLIVFDPNGRTASALDYDYMITARYEHGPLGIGPAVEWAALVPSPVAAIAPPAPANMAQQMMGNLRPVAADGPWRASVRVSWDRPVPIPLFRPRSFAFARSGVTPPSPAELLMNKRSDGSPLPIAVNNFTVFRTPSPTG